MYQHLRKHIEGARRSSLFMNAFYLMLSTFVLAFCGFLFWVFIARTYNAAAVGLATTLLSVSSLLSLLSLAGFDTTFVRFLPKAKHRASYIHSGIIVVSLMSFCLALGMGVALPWFSDDLALLRSPSLLAAFVFFTIVAALMVLINAVFLAFKKARYTLIINTIFSLLKVVLAVCVAQGDAATIFMLAGGAQLVGLLLAFLWLKRKFGYVFLPKPDWQTLKLVRKFSFSMYFSSVLNLLPPTLLPLIIMYQLGPESSAYYYMAFTIASVLYTVAYASMQSVFAEGSHDEASLVGHLKKAAKLVGILLIPASIITAAVSGVVLHIFGESYARNAAVLLQLFALGALPVAAYSALGAIFKVTKNLAGTIAMNIVYAGVILYISYALLNNWGLPSVGWAWVMGNIAACVIGTFFFFIKRGGEKL